MSQLSSQFLDQPKYSCKVSLSNGREVFISDPKAVRAMLALMDMQAVLGGAASHWGGPSAFLEIFSALFGLIFHQSKNWHEQYHIVNDAGHCENGLYTIKANYEYAGLKIQDLKKFRSLSSFLTGHGEAHLFPQGVYLSNGPLSSTLAQAQGLCLADRLQKKERTTVVLASDGALMEGEAKEALASIPGFAGKNRLNPFILIISDNNTKLSGRINEDSFSLQPTLKSLSVLGWKTVSLDSAHNLQETVLCLEKTLKEVSQNQPIAVQAKTIKGHGVQKTEESASGGHGFPLKDPQNLTAFLNEIYKGEKIPEEFLKWSQEMVHLFHQKKSNSTQKNSQTQNNKDVEIKYEKVQVGVSQALIKKKEEGFPLVSVSSDLQGSTGVMGFRKKFPEYSFDVGVAEANMVSMAVGLSKQGFIPVVDTFAQFGVSKGALPLFMAVLSQAPVIAFFSHIGFQDAADGASHQCLSYLAQTGSIPHTYIYTLSSSAEAQSLTEQAVDQFKKEKKNFIFFLGRENFPSSYLPKKYSYQLNKAQLVFSTFIENFADSPQDVQKQLNKPSRKFKKTCTLTATGTLLGEALKAGRLLAKEGWGIHVIHPSIINEPDIETLQSCLSQTQGNLLTIEDHQLKGGMGAFLTQALSLNSIPFQIHSLGVKGGFGRSAYQAIDLYRLHGLDHTAIVQAVKSYFS